MEHVELIEQKMKRVEELKEYLACYGAMREKIINYSPHPGMRYNLETKKMEPVPWPKDIQELLDKVAEMEKDFVLYWFPDLYNNLYT